MSSPSYTYDAIGNILSKEGTESQPAGSLQNRSFSLREALTPTPERVMRWGGRVLAEAGYKVSGKLIGALGVALEPGGLGKMSGIVVGGTAGAKAGAALGAAFSS